jgi:hypothetical protein
VWGRGEAGIIALEICRERVDASGGTPLVILLNRDKSVLRDTYANPGPYPRVPIAQLHPVSE